MRKLWIMLGTGLLGAAALVVVTGTAPEATAARNPLKASVRCRKIIGSSLLQVATAGLKAIEKCHVQRLKRGLSSDCNALSANATYSRAQARAVARMRVACKEGDPVLQNYGGASSISQGFQRSFEVIRRELEESGSELLGSPVFEGDRKSVKARGKCHGMLGKGRTGVVQGVLRSAFKCQQRIDKRAQSFGPLDPSCLSGAGGPGSKASGKITRACNSFGGEEMGSCASLPGCLVSSAETTAHTIARLTYGGPAVCGNGLEDPGETCDDANTVDNDGCTATCQFPSCGDLSVNDPAEECDEPNPGVSGDQPNQNCFDCKLNVCGDGNVDTEEPRVEECDDGNTVASDGCTNCVRDGTACGADGLAATVTLEFSKEVVAGVSAARVAFAYPAAVNIPGSGTAASVRERVTSLLPDDINFRVFAPAGDRDTNGDGIDDEILVQAATGFGEIDPGPFMRVQFDCAPGTAIRPGDFVCSIPAEGLSNAAGLPFAPELIAQVSCVVTLGGAPIQTTTTTSTTVTTTSTPVSTTTTTTPVGCGNGVLDAGEECDDNNLDPNDGCTSSCTICGNNIITLPESCDDGMPPALDDNCPEDCRIELCTPTSATQAVTIVASRPDLTGITFLLDYPDGRIAIPGSGDVSAQFTDAPGPLTALDLEHAVRVNVSEAFTFETTQIARANFPGCEGATLPSASDYRCIVISAVDAGFMTVGGVTCSVTIP